MEGVRPWQIGVIVLGLIGLAISVGFQVWGTERVVQANSIMLVDVTTGELVKTPVPKGRAYFFPGVNPRSGQATLWPVMNVDGQWVLGTRYREPALTTTKGTQTVIEDPTSGRVKVASQEVTRVDVFPAPK